MNGLCGEGRDKLIEGDEPIKCVVICREATNAEYYLKDQMQP